MTPCLPQTALQVRRPARAAATPQQPQLAGSGAAAARHGVGGSHRAAPGQRRRRRGQRQRARLGAPVGAAAAGGGWGGHGHEGGGAQGDGYDGQERPQVRRRRCRCRSPQRSQACFRPPCRCRLHPAKSWTPPLPLLLFRTSPPSLLLIVAARPPLPSPLLQLELRGHALLRPRSAVGERWVQDLLPAAVLAYCTAPVPPRCACCARRSRHCHAAPLLPAVPFSEMLSAEVLPPVRGMWRLPGTKLHRLVVWTFRRMAHSPAAWQPRQVRPARPAACGGRRLGKGGRWGCRPGAA